MHRVILTAERRAVLRRLNKYIQTYFEFLEEDDIFDADELLEDRSLNFTCIEPESLFQLDDRAAGILADLYPMLVNHEVACIYDSYSSTYTVTVAKGLWWDAFEVEMDVEEFVKHMLSRGVLNFRNKPRSWLDGIIEPTGYERKVPACFDRSEHGRPARRRKQK